MRQKIMAGNWKMNKSIEESVKLASELNSPSNVTVIIAPVFTSLLKVKDVIGDKNIRLAAQNMHFAESGAFTGEISPLMLKEVGCEYVILGHSERRNIFGENDELINQKVKSALSHNLKPILCVGELLNEREKGVTNEIISSQIELGLKNVSEEEMKNVVIAYEPVWAIGTGKVATPEQANEAHNVIRQKVREIFSEEIANNIQILYGGSVKPENVDVLLALENVDGGLVGGASLDAKSFNALIESADKQVLNN